MNTRTVSLLALFVFLGVLMRIAALQFHPYIEGDGIHYASLARDMLVLGDLRIGLEPYRASLYQYLILFVSHYFVLDISLAGQSVSILSGALLTIPIYLLARELFSENVAVLAALLVIIHQTLVRFSVTLFTEALFLLFLYLGIYTSGFAHLPNSKKDCKLGA